MAETNLQKFYITTAIDYINGQPHIGHAYEKVASDVLARHYRAKGGTVRFLTGTDEHGAKISAYAAASGLGLQEFADQAASDFQSAWDNLKVSYDRFIRTTDTDHMQAVAQLVSTIRDNGYLYEGDYEGLYCVGHEAFLTDKDLVDGLCPDHKVKPELVKEKNWFFKLSESVNGRPPLTDTIKQAIDSNQLLIYPEHSRKEILAMLGEGFRDIAVTRPNVKWGIPVPWDSEQTVYVWVDALINYYSGAKAGEDDFWPADVHMIGPDIAKFHCIIWPALLLAANLPLPKAVAIHGFLTLNHQKLSKTTGNTVDPNEWVAKYGSDAVRYFLMREVPFDSHGDVSEEKLRARYEGDLANGLGNLLSRVTNLIEKSLDGRVDRGLAEQYDLHTEDVAQDIRGYKFHDALAKIWQNITLANKIVDEQKLWELAKTDLVSFERHCASVLNIIERCAHDLLPFMPDTAEKILTAVTAEKITKAEPLFPKIESE